MADGGLSGVFAEIKTQLQVLAVAGVGGAFFRAMFAPEVEWRRRVVQGIGGAMSAIFLGGVVGQLVEAATGAGVYAYLASGFILGAGGEVVVKRLQDRALEHRGRS